MKLYYLIVLSILVVNGYGKRSHRHRQFQDLLDNEEQYMELRATNDTDTGILITLQNRAAMNTRLRVLYTDANGNPGIGETGRVWGWQTKSVRLPAGAQHVRVIVEKDIFFESWRVVYDKPLEKPNQCIRITGVTFRSRIHLCK